MNEGYQDALLSLLLLQEGARQVNVMMDYRLQALGAKSVGGRVGKTGCCMHKPLSAIKLGCVSNTLVRV